MTRQNEYEKNVPYKVVMKDSSYIIPSIYRKFCGYLVNAAAGRFFFELDGNRMLIIIPYADIDYMYPSVEHMEQHRNEENGI